MKTGVIVYVAGGERLDDAFDLEEQIKQLKINADKIAIVSGKWGYFDVMDAWWMLISKGMKSIVCMLAEVNHDLRIRLTGKQLRLSG